MENEKKVDKEGVMEVWGMNRGEGKVAV